MQNERLGRIGEDAVARELEANGFSLLARNARVGRLELDLIARRGALLVFCEVKTAHARSRFDPVLRLSEAQCKRLRRAASGWLSEHPQPGIHELRLDAAFVVLDGEGQATVRYYEAAF